MILQMPKLGAHGRFGNQFFQYLFLKLAQHELGCDIRYTDWIGTLMFDIAPASAMLPPSRDLIDLELSLVRGDGPRAEFDRLAAEAADNPDAVIDISGHFQYHSRHLASYRDEIAGFFPFRRDFAAQLDAALERGGADQRHIVALHIRRGDYLTFSQNEPLFWGISMDAVFALVEDLFDSSLSDGVIYLASDDLDYCEAEFAKRGIPCFSHRQLFSGLDSFGEILCDFMMMSRADSLAISNSSFSFSAAMLNRRARQFVRPSPRQDKFIPFDPWNSHVLLRRML